MSGYDFLYMSPDDHQMRDKAQALLGDLEAGRTRLEIGGLDLSPEMIRLMRANDVWTTPNIQRGSLWLSSGREEAKAVGRSVYDKVGLDGIRAFHQAVLGTYDRVALAELSAAWDGVGQWRS